MKIKDIWNKFLELRKSPVCFLFSLMGLVNLIVLFYIIIFRYTSLFSSDISLIIYFFCRTYYAAIFSLAPYKIILFVFIFSVFMIEALFRIKINSVFFEKNKTYKLFWLIGFVCAILVFYILKPLLKVLLDFNYY